MKANELMIGDWVMFGNDCYRIKDLKSNGAIHLLETKWNTRVELTTDFIEDDLKPVPISPEILTKNGFTNTGIAAQRLSKDIFSIEGTLPGCLGYGLDTDYLGCWFFQKFDCAFNPQTGRNDDESLVEDYYNIPISYVHELQHTLKLLNINKEIELN